MRQGILICSLEVAQLERVVIMPLETDTMISLKNV